MRKITFIGGYDKTDLILYIAKILTEMGQKVLIVDGTITQRARYIVPTIEPSTKYITEFEKIDVAVGFENMQDIKQYLAIPEINELAYDIVLTDIDNPQSAMEYHVEDSEKIYFSTSFDMYSIRRGIEAVSGITSKVHVTKVLFSRQASKKENEYLDYLTSESNIIWNNEIIYMPFELGDQTTIYTNQRVSKIKLKGLTNQYKEGLMYLASQIMGEENYGLLRKVFKKIEKGV